MTLPGISPQIEGGGCAVAVDSQHTGVGLKGHVTDYARSPSTFDGLGVAESVVIKDICRCAVRPLHHGIIYADTSRRPPFPRPWSPR